MMKETVQLKETFKVPPSVLYAAWLSSETHSAMTGGAASCDDQVGGSFSAWDGYISGKNIELIQDKQIVQSWRTTEFEPTDEDSILSIHFHEVEGGTEVVLEHTQIPEGQTQYEQGWINHYFVPMKEHFG